MGADDHSALSDNHRCGNESNMGRHYSGLQSGDVKLKKKGASNSAGLRFECLSSTHPVLYLYKYHLQGIVINYNHFYLRNLNSPPQNNNRHTSSV